MRPAVPPVFALVPLLWAPPAAASSACFESGIEALDAERFADAAAAFEAAARRDACRADAVDLRFNAGFALQRLAAREPDAACRAVGAYREVVASTPDPELARTARARIAEMQPVCLASQPQDTGWMLRSAIAAGIAAVGTGVVYALALDADGDRAAAKADYITLRQANRPDEAEDARRRFEDARNTTDALGVTAYIGLALSLTLAGLAIGGWFTADEPATVSVGPGGVGFEVRW